MVNIERDFLNLTEQDIKNYENLKNICQKICDIEEQLLKKRKGIIDDISNISKAEKEDKSIINEIYEEYKKKMKENEEYRNNFISKIKTSYMPALIESLSHSKNEKKKLDLNLYKKYEKSQQEKQLEIAKQENDNLKQSQLNQDIARKEKEIKAHEDTIDEAIIKYQKHRILNYKYIILHLIHNKLNYHTKSVENLTRLYKTIKDLKPNDELRTFCDKYNIKTVNLKENKMNIKNPKPDIEKSKIEITTSKREKGMITKSIYSDNLEEDI